MSKRTPCNIHFYKSNTKKREMQQTKPKKWERYVANKSPQTKAKHARRFSKAGKAGIHILSLMKEYRQRIIYQSATYYVQVSQSDKTVMINLKYIIRQVSVRFYIQRVYFYRSVLLANLRIGMLQSTFYLP